MKLFSSSSGSRIGVIVDIGSASVLVAIVESDKGAKAPKIIWSHREHLALRTDNDLEQLARNVITAFMNASLLLESSGRKVLAQVLGSATAPNYLSVTVAAPWSYTVTKTITYATDEAFTINTELVKELERTAEQKIMHELKENDVMTDLGLSIVTKSTIAILANGYPIKTAYSARANSLALSRTSAVIQKYLADSITEFREKMLPRATLHQASFMLGYFSVIRALYPTLTEYCLVDITYEATEIGVVREGVLQYCTHTPYGAFSLARDIAEVQGIPLGEAYGRLTAQNLIVAETKKEVQTIYKNYETRLTELFNETGDALSIPKTVLLHNNLDTEEFFAERLRIAAANATRGQHHIIPVSQELITSYYDEAATADLRTRHDTALLVSAQFFHNSVDDTSIEWQ